jgi:hypothetical protein
VETIVDETKDEQMVVRIHGALLARVDASAERLGREMRGPSWKRSDMVRLLLAKALDEAGPRRGAGANGPPQCFT